MASNNPEKNGAEDWWHVLLPYLSKEQASLWTRSLNYLLKERGNPKILSAVIQSIAITGIVLDGLAKHCAKMAANLQTSVDQIGKQNDLLRQNTEAVSAARVELAGILQALEVMCTKIEKATIPWGKAFCMCTLSSGITLAMFLNADHLWFMRIPNSADIHIEQLVQENNTLQNKVLEDRDTIIHFKSNLAFHDQDTDVVGRRQFMLGYKKALEDMQSEKPGP